MALEPLYEAYREAEQRMQKAETKWREAKRKREIVSDRMDEMVGSSPDGIDQALNEYGEQYVTLMKRETAKHSEYLAADEACNEAMHALLTVWTDESSSIEPLETFYEGLKRKRFLIAAAHVDALPSQLNELARIHEEIDEDA